MELQLIGNNIKLVPYDEQYLNYLYSHIIMNKVEGFEECKLKQKKDLYNFMSNKNLNMKLFIKDLSNDKICGYIGGYNYNKIDGYIYISTILGEKEKKNKEAINIFVQYIFKCFPIRKIYCEICDNNKDKLITFQDMGFQREATLEEDTFFDGTYYNKHILSLYREDYKNE